MLILRNPPQIQHSTEPASMWCRHCHQDVFVFSHPGSTENVCTSCGKELAFQAKEDNQALADDSGQSAKLPVRLFSPKKDQAEDCLLPNPEIATTEFDSQATPGTEPTSEIPPWNWLAEREFDNDLCQIQLLVERTRKLTRRNSDAGPSFSVASMAEIVPTPSNSSSSTQLKATETHVQTSVNETPIRGMLIWCCFVFGFGALVCGVILLGWGWMQSRPSLWTIGVPLAVGGQFAIVIGMTSRLHKVASDAEWRLERSKSGAIMANSEATERQAA
jgi:hypothetical protein